MTLFMSDKRSEGIYREIIEQYKTHGDANNNPALSRNPILFLNKLTHLKMFFDAFRFVEFTITRKPDIAEQEMIFEDNIDISLNIKDYSKGGLETNEHHELKCFRYTMPVVYGREECVSRYGDNTPFISKRHIISAIIPRPEELKNHITGRMYSFLPTQISLSVSMALHVPFKLDGSREFVDPQGNNAWFTFTYRQLITFFHKAYLSLSRQVGKEILKYLTKSASNIFVQNNQKVKCLATKDFQGSAFLNEKLFLTESGSYEAAGDVVAFPSDIPEDEQRSLYLLLNTNKKLFISAYKEDLKTFGIMVVTNPFDVLFAIAARGADTSAQIFKLLSRQEDFNLIKAMSDWKDTIQIDSSLVETIASDKNLSEIFGMASRKNSIDNSGNKFMLKGTFNILPAEQNEIIIDTLKDTGMDAGFTSYYQNHIKDIYTFPAESKGFYLAAANGIILSEKTPLQAFGSLAEQYDERNIFSATLKLRQASDALNAVGDDVTSSEYMEILRGVRKSQESAFGKNLYQKYITIINNSSSDKKRFLSELLQNADDCDYAEGVVPSFYLEQRGNILQVQYNELGFSKDNVRAITAIGESTKKLLLSGEDSMIGEKGVGFKSVFGVASAVEIHSNGFDFRLTDVRPIFPAKVPPKDIASEPSQLAGTAMTFLLKEDVSDSFSVSNILRLCLCLRKLRQIIINGTNVLIEDGDDYRTVTVNESTYRFEKYVYPFTVIDEAAIKERQDNARYVSKNQKIVLYLPGNYKGDRFVYCGLPTAVKSNVPLIVDAPFELNTARTDIVDSKWSKEVRNNMYKAILYMMDRRKKQERLDVFQYTGYILKLYGNVQKIMFEPFSSPFLNEFGWITPLRLQKLLPVLGTENLFIAPIHNQCILVPDVIRKLADQYDITDFFKGTLIDTKAHKEYGILLTNIGCRYSTVEEEFPCIQEYAYDLVMDDKTRESLYEYLIEKAVFTKPSTQGKALLLPIIPVRLKDGTKYIKYSKNIYINDSMKSGEGFYILDTSKMPVATATNLLGNQLSFGKFDDDLLEKKYVDNMMSVINNSEDLQKIAEYVLSESEGNSSMFNHCLVTLRGMVDDIPMKMSDGSYQRGKKFTNTWDQFFAGSVLGLMIVDKNYERLARRLNLQDISNVRFADIDVNIDMLSDDDIEDFSYVDNYFEIIRGFYNAGKIKDDQIERYGLDFVRIGGRDFEEDDIDEDFPVKPIKNREKLINHIRQQWKAPNQYISVPSTIRKPQHPINYVAYLSDMYGTNSGVGKSFCQMCGKPIKDAYIERSDIQIQPKYAWSQMYLNLCLTCSKDYIYLRNNQVAWQNFVKAIKKADVSKGDNIEIPIGDKTITFTATHLAEIQEIFRLEKE